MTTTPSLMECERAREALLDDQHGTLTVEDARALRAHLQGCAACTKLEAQERWLSELVRTRLSRPLAPRALRERLAAQVTAVAQPAPRRAFWQKPGFSVALAAAALLMVAGRVAWVLPRAPTGSELGSQTLLREAVNDHLRVVYATHPIEIESGGIHQVKPWFTGRLDFAPDVTFSGDADFPMVGGAIGYFVDRKAATFVFTRRLHTISCFVFRAQGLAWPEQPSAQRTLAGGRKVQVSAIDGFHVVLWRDGDLGHALVSDVSEPELLKLGDKLVAP